MRMIRVLGSVAASLVWLLTPVCFAQTGPTNAVPLITQVTPPSLSPATMDPSRGIFALTILGADFPPNAIVRITSTGNVIGQTSNAVVNSAGTQITAQFVGLNLVIPSVIQVTVVNPNGPQLLASNIFNLPVSSAPPSFALNSAVNSFVNGYPTAMATGDFDMNGTPDLAIISQPAGMVSIFSGNPDGTFTSGATYQTGNSPAGIVAADFTGSGQLDLAITNSGDNTITILLANGPGNFRPGSTIQLPDGFPTAIIAADFNGDGRMDLAVVNRCGFYIGICNPAAGPIRVPGTVSVLLGNGDGTFSITPSYNTHDGASAIAAADFNGDGFIDLVITNQSSNDLTVLMGDGHGTFAPAFHRSLAGFAPTAIAIGDFNGDGAIDLAVTNSQDNTVSILLNQNCASAPPRYCTFGPGPAAIPVGASPSAIAAGDMNEDGFLDLVVVNSQANSISVLLGDGTGNFTPVVPFLGPFATGQSPQAIVLGDFNRDGRLDVATTNSSGSYSIITQAAAASVVLSGGPSSSFYGQPVAFTATVTSGPGQVAPTGSVAFFDGSTPIGSAPLNNYFQQAYLQFSGLTAGVPHQISAVYGGDSNYALSTSNVLTQTVTQAQTYTTLTSSLNTAPYGQAFTLTATIQPQTTGTATGTINFVDQYSFASVGTASVGNNVAQLTLSNLPPGPHTIIAMYQGDTNFFSSQSVSYTENIIQASSTTTLTATPNPTSFGTSVTFTATIKPGTGTTVTGGGVAFMDGSTTLGFANVSNNFAQFTPALLSVGAHNITAQYTGDTNFSGSTSSALAETVNPAAVSLTLASSLNPSAYAQAAVITGTVQGASVSTTPTGSLTLLDGSTVLGSATLSSGSAQFTLPVLSVGPHAITATYAGDANYQPGTSPQVTQNVSQASVVATITASPSPSSFAQPVTLTTTLQPAFGGAATGNVTFYDGSGLLGTVTPTSNSAQFTLSNLNAESHFFSASYLGDANTVASVATAIAQTVNPSATTTTITSNLNPSSYGQSVTFAATVKAAFGTLPAGQVSFFDGTTLLGTVSSVTTPAQIMVQTLTSGTHSITAQYAPGNANFAASTSTPVTQTINQTATTTTINLLSNGVAYGTYAQVLVIVNAPYPYSSSTGSITLYDGGTSVQTAAVQGNGVTFTVSGLTVGTHSLTASFSGDSNLLASTSSAYTQTIVQEPTLTTLTPSSLTLGYGQPLTLSVSVKPINGTTATGTITFQEGTTAIGTVTLTSNAAQLTLSNVTPGTHYYAAQYSGDANTASSVGSAGVTAAGPPTTTIVTVNPNPAVLNQSVTFTATIQHTASGTPTGTVWFYSGTNLLTTSTVINGSAQFTDSSGFAVGTQSITATYGGDSNFSGSTSAVLSELVNPGPTTTTVWASPNPSILNTNATFTVTVNAFPISNGLATGLVSLFDGTTSLGSMSLPSGNNYVVFTVSTLTAGTHAITAQYGGSASLAPSTSSVLSQTVNLPATTITLNSSPNPAGYGQPVSLVASVQTPGSGTATGTVTFYNGATSIGTSTVSNNSAQLSISSLPIGGNSLTAKYSGDTNYAGSVSAILGETINQSATTATVSSSANPATVGQPVTFTASVTPAFGTSPTGTVTFYDGSSSVGTVTMSSAAAQITSSGLSIGSHSITAKYSGDANFSASTSSAFSQTISQASTTATVTSSVSPAVFGQSVVFSVRVQSSSSGTPTGTVMLMDGGTSLGSSALPGSGVAQFTVGGLLAGSHSITATYSGDANFSGSTSTALGQVVNRASTTTSLSSSANPSSYGQSVTFTGSVVPATGGGVTGTMTFLDGGVQFGTATVSSNVATFATGATSLNAGSHSITVSYSGDSNFAASTSPVLTQTVNALGSSGLAMDAQASGDQSTAKSTVATSAFSTIAGDELLLAFVATDYLSGGNTTVKSVSGGGLTWVLVLRANKQSGTSEIWRAFASSPVSNATVTASLSQSVAASITVVSFAGVNITGTNGSGAIGATKSASAGSGAPTATLVTTHNNSWVFGVGNDFDQAIPRTTGAGQILVHQYLSPVGDTYWVQRQNAPTPLSGSSVILNDTAPTGDRYNLAICEILSAQ